jgi:hypothetical protein
MSQTRKAVLVVAMLVVSAVAVASASAALPEFVPGPGGFPNHFTALQLGTGILETRGEIGGKKRTVECSHGSTLGFIKSEKDLLVNSIVYTGCKSTAFGAGKCQSGATEGEIITLPLLGLLGYINKATPTVGILFEPDGTIEHFASFNCKTLAGNENLTVKGSVICKLSPVNTTTKDYHLLCEQANGIQNPLKFEGTTAEDTLLTSGSGPENFGFEKSAVKALYDVLTLEVGKINA